MTLASRLGLSLAVSAVLVLPVVPSPAAGGQPHEHGVSHIEVVADGNALAINLRGAGYHLVGFEHAPEDAEQRAAWADTRERLADAGKLFAPSPAARCRVEDARVDPPEAGDALASGEHGKGHGDVLDHHHGGDSAAHASSGQSAKHGHGHDHGHRHGHDEASHDHHARHESGNGHSHGHAHGHENGHKHGHEHGHGGHASDWSATYRFACEAPARLEYIDVTLFDVFPAHEEVRYQRLSGSGQSGGTLTAGNLRLRMR